MGSSHSITSGKFIVDSIHGDIHPQKREWKVIDTPSFQRLRHIKQLQMSQVTYPNATHTRFAHSLGTLGIMDRVITIVQQNNSIRLKPREKENLRLAALLHDIGHYPYSHLMESLDNVELAEEKIDLQQKTLDKSKAPYPRHEELGGLIVTNQEDILSAIGNKARAKEVADLFTRSNAENPQLLNLITSSLDLDRFDYLLRDSYAVGVPYGHIDINYLLNSLKISPSGIIGISEKALPAAEQFLLARFFMHRTVYYHKTTYGMEEACRQLLKRVRDSGRYDVFIPRDGEKVKELVKSQQLGTFTDAYVDKIVQEAVNDDEDEVIKALAKTIQSRRPPKLLKEVSVLEERSEDYHAGATFKKTCIHELRSLAEKFGIPLGQFLLCELKPLTFEKRGDRITPQEAKTLPAEDEDELIKVFVEGKDDPVPIVDVEHSIISKLSGYCFRMYRLYVVYEKNDKEKMITNLRKAVEDWKEP